MASSNIKLFDENKGNMLSDSEFSISTQRLNGLQTGVASSQLQNKAMYQASLMAYAIAQVMMQNGKDANDTDAVSAFVANLSGAMLQKVYDVATTAEAQAGVATGKWMSPALVKAAIDTFAASAGYGFGEELYEIRADSASESYETFCAKVESVLSTMPKNTIKAVVAYPPQIYGLGRQACLLYKLNNDYASLRTVGNYDDFFGISMRKTNGVWHPLEWVNPPMELGKEYRTIERYLFKPVYVKSINFGTLPNNSTASVRDDFRATNIVSICGITSDGNYFPYYSGHTSSVGRVDIYANRYGNIWVTTTTDKSAETATIIIKYTKD